MNELDEVARILAELREKRGQPLTDNERRQLPGELEELTRQGFFGKRSD
jgi:hypothetical protein